MPIKLAARLVAAPRLHLPRRMLEDFLRDAADRRARRHQLDLDLARGDKTVHEAERFADGPPDGQQTMIAHDHGVLVAEVGDDAGRLVGLLGEPFEVVIGDFAVERAATLIDVDQPFLGCRDDDTGARVDVEGALDVGLLAQDGTVEVEPGRTRRKVGFAEDIAVEVAATALSCSCFIR